MSDTRGPIRICFVCLGNICRSPTAEAVMRQLLREGGLTDAVQVESAGTGNWHVGQLRDGRSRAVGERRGIPLTGRAQQFLPQDFARFDHVVAMDRQNVEALLAMAPDHSARAKITLLRSYEGEEAGADCDVPDPYHGGEAGFDRVFDICASACRAFLTQLQESHRLSASP